MHVKCSVYALLTINPDKMTSVILNLKYLLINPINWVYLSVQGE